MRAELARLPAYVEPPRVAAPRPKTSVTAIVTIVSVLSVTGVCFGLQFYPAGRSPDIPTASVTPPAAPQPPRQQAWQDVPLPDGVRPFVTAPAPRATHPARAVRASSG